MPTKTRVASAYAAHLARRSAEFGVMIDGPIRVDMRRVEQRKDEVALRARRNVEAMAEGHRELECHRRPRALRGPNAVRVDDRLLHAERIFINVGVAAHWGPRFPA